MTKLYVMFCDETGLYKVGRSDDPANRALVMRRNSIVPITIRLVAAMWAFHTLERSAHAYLADLREHGEWFRHGPRLDALVAAMRGGSLMRRHLADHADIFELAEEYHLGPVPLQWALCSRPRLTLGQLMGETQARAA